MLNKKNFNDVTTINCLSDTKNIVMSHEGSYSALVWASEKNTSQKNEMVNVLLSKFLSY